MARIPAKRLVIYLVVITTLSYSLARALTTQNSLRKLTHSSGTTAQELPQAPDFNSSNGSSSASSSGPRRTEPDDIDDDDALLALNSLSNDDAGPESASERAEVQPTPTLTVGTPTPSTDNFIGGARDDSDSRSTFADAQQPDPNSIGIDGFIGGGRSNTGGGAATGPGGDPAVTTPTSPFAGWVSGQARGYTMLYAMQPEARAVVESNVATLLAAQVREPYIGVLIDGTFAQDFEYLKSVISRLSVDRNLTLELYLTNGPTQRKWDKTVIDAPFVKIPPRNFRKSILSDAGLQRTFSALAAQGRELFEFSKSRNAANQALVSVMLEDNLDVKAYRKMRELAAQQLDNTASFIRSTCYRCVDPLDRESDVDTAGDAREEHHPNKLGELKRGDGLSLDGTGFRYPTEGGAEGLSPEELRSAIQASYSKGLRFFALWRHGWQGAESSGENPHPEERNYVVSTPEQEAFELEMLRLGLIPEPIDDSENDMAIAAR